MKKTAFILLVAVTAASCYYDVEEELYPPAGPCDTGTAVTYSTTITGLMTSYGCLGCHSGTVPSGNVNLSTYAGVKTRVDNNELWGAINHQPGFTPMPQGMGKMSTCDIAKIKVWMDAGAPNN
jgi:hypothetical protein